MTKHMKARAWAKDDVDIRQVRAAGFFGLIIIGVIYAGCFYGITYALHRSGFDIAYDWAASLIAGYIYIIIRSLDRAFFKREE